MNEKKELVLSAIQLSYQHSPAQPPAYLLLSSLVLFPPKSCHVG